VRPGAVSPDRALCLPNFSHFLIVNKTSLSLSLSIHLPPQCGEATSHAGEEEESRLITCALRHSVDYVSCLPPPPATCRSLLLGCVEASQSLRGRITLTQ
jgi:hypothetical protein